MNELVDWEEEMVRLMMKKGLSEEEAWRRMEKIHMDLIREESEPSYSHHVSYALELIKEAGFKVEKIISIKDKYCDGHLFAKVSGEGNLEYIKKHLDDAVLEAGILKVWWVNC